MSVSENGPAPLLSVARTCPFGDSAMPNGFGASTLTSVPAGVTSRPFGSTAARTPSMTVAVVAGRFPAGAEKFTNFESAPLGPPGSAVAVQLPDVRSPHTMMPPAIAVTILCRAKYSPIRASLPLEFGGKVRDTCVDLLIAE